MNFTVQTESPILLKEALASECHSIRFGTEFCETKLPTLENLMEAWEATEKAGKSFIYVTPILSNSSIEKIRGHFNYLKDLGSVEVVIGDFGTLNILQNYKGLHPRLGRIRVYIPARCPWPQITRMPNSSELILSKVEKIFYQTGLNNQRTLEFIKTYGVEAADVDWIPKCFPYLEQMIRGGFKIAVYADALPVSFTERCHMARFLEEEESSICKSPCLSKALIIKQKELGTNFILCGNVIYRLVQPATSDIKELKRIGVDEIVFSMGPVSKLLTAKAVNEAIADLVRWV